MKSKICLIIIAALLLSITLFGCGTTAAKTEDTKSSNSIDVDNNILTVTITIPASFYENYDQDTPTQEELDENVSIGDGILSEKLNDDGSVTVVMTKAARDEMLNGFKEKLDESIDRLLNDENNSMLGYDNITYNNDMTEFTIIKTASNVTIFDSVYNLIWYMYGGYYNLFSGKDDYNITVTYINKDSGDVIAVYDTDSLKEEE